MTQDEFIEKLDEAAGFKLNGSQVRDIIRLAAQFHAAPQKHQQNATNAGDTVREGEPDGPRCKCKTVQGSRFHNVGCPRDPRTEPDGPLTIEAAIAELEPDTPDSFIQYPPGRLRAILTRLAAGATGCCGCHGHTPHRKQERCFPCCGCGGERNHD